jgi:hypothetical protein
LTEFLQDRYFVLLVRLSRPTDIIMTVVPLLIAEAILESFQRTINDNIDEIYGVLS